MSITKQRQACAHLNVAVASEGDYSQMKNYENKFVTLSFFNYLAAYLYKLTIATLISCKYSTWRHCKINANILKIYDFVN